MAVNKVIYYGEVLVDMSQVTVKPEKMLEGETALDASGQLIEGTIESQAAQTITPGTSNKTIAAGRYLTGTQIIKGDVNLVPENIVEGVSIFGIVGTATKPPTGVDIPSFAYSGTYNLIDEGALGWQIEFLTSGTLKPDYDMVVDIFCVGGGGAGECASYAYAAGGAGGGGGYTSTTSKVTLKAGVYYTVTVGDGGTIGATSGSYSTNAAGNAGGASSVASSSETLCIANGGKGGANQKGGAGGSGGGSCAAINNQWMIGHGGSDGSNGINYGSWSDGNGGSGQGTTTRAFGESSGKLYAGGGGGAVGSQGTNGYGTGLGGEGGGGDGATDNSSSKKGEAGEANTGGGGGGGSYGANSAGAGGSGIVIMRNTHS